MTHPLVDLMDDLARNAAPVRWYHFLLPLAALAFVLFCVGYTLWGLIA